MWPAGRSSLPLPPALCPHPPSSTLEEMMPTHPESLHPTHKPTHPEGGALGQWSKLEDRSNTRGSGGAPVCLNAYAQASLSSLVIISRLCCHAAGGVLDQQGHHAWVRGRYDLGGGGGGQEQEVRGGREGAPPPPVYPTQHAELGLGGTMHTHIHIHTYAQ